MRRLVLAILILEAAAHAQNPPGIEWRRILSPHFEIVFPRGLEADATRSANELETFYGPMSDSFGIRPKRATVILDNQSPTRWIGGYVNLSPLRSLWYTPPSQGSIGTNRWLTLMAAHEGRHLIQFRAMDRGFARATSLLFGDAGRGLMLGWSMPTWWLEGDATVAETAFTAGGQGRLPGNSLFMRANVLAGRRFSYMKAMHGSYNDVLPDSYQLGSVLISRVNRSSGTAAWSRILRRWAGNSWNPFALSRAMRKETGRGAADTYTEAVSELREQWEAKTERTPNTADRILNQKPKKVWTSYSFPVYEPGRTVLARKNGLADHPIELVRIHLDGTEEVLFQYAPANSRVSLAGGRLVWDEYVPDARWRRGWSEIVIHDLASGQRRRLTHHTRFEAPALSPEGSRVAAVEFTANGVCSLAILDAQTGSAMRFPAPADEFLFTPAWSADGSSIAVVRQTGNGMKTLSILNRDSGDFSDLIGPSRVDLTRPAFAGEYVLYGSTLNGIDNIYAVHTGTRARYQVTSARLGASYAQTGEGRLLYSDYTVDGYNVAEQRLDPASWRPVEEVEYAGVDYHETGAHDYTAEAFTKSYQSERYHPLRRVIDLHSWGVTSPPPEMGFGIQSTDKMGLLNVTAAVKYDWNEKTTGYEATASFNALYPILDFSLSRKSREVRHTGYTEKWSERAARVGFRIPLDLSRGIYDTSLTAGSSIEARRIGSGGLTPLNYWLSFSRFRQGAARDVASAWGQSVFVGYQHTPWNGAYHGDLMTAAGTLFVPSPVRHHSIQFEVANERRHGGNYTFSSQMVFPRGYDSVAGGTLWKGSANYALLLLYPDLALSQIAYLKRITGNLYFDYGRSTERTYRSAGVEVLFDVHALSMLDAHNARVEPFVAFGW